MTRNANIVAVTSGKGGVGKTHISANLGILLTKQGRRTCVIDADHGLANINLILGLPAPLSTNQLFQPDFDVKKAMITTDQGLDVLPSASGISKRVDAKPPTKEEINLLINKLKPLYDVILIDTAAGINSTVRNYLSVADHVLLVINSEPTSLTDSFGLIRKMKNIQPFYNVVINRAANAATATGIYKRFAGAVRKYIGAQVGAIGYISEDSFMSAAVLSQTAVVDYSPNGQATQCLKRISRMLARKLMEPKSDSVEIHSIAEEQKIEPKATEELPNTPEFIKTDAMVDPFEQWISQLPLFLDEKSATEKTRSKRNKMLVKELEALIEKDKQLLADIEEIVVNSSIKNSQSIIEQTNIADRLAKTRFVEEPIAFDLDQSIQTRNSGVAKAFSIISRLK